jgi:hypothetical protein
VLELVRCGEVMRGIDARARPGGVPATAASCCRWWSWAAGSEGTRPRRRAQGGRGALAAHLLVLAADGRRLDWPWSAPRDTEDIVVQADLPPLREGGTFAGATVLGDGRVALILDAHALAMRAGLAAAADAPAAGEEPCAHDGAPGRRACRCCFVPGGLNLWVEVGSSAAGVPSARGGAPRPRWIASWIVRVHTASKRLDEKNTPACGWIGEVCAWQRSQATSTSRAIARRVRGSANVAGLCRTAMRDRRVRCRGTAVVDIVDWVGGEAASRAARPDGEIHGPHPDS